jgi:hypothetical protein
MDLPTITMMLIAMVVVLTDPEESVVSVMVLEDKPIGDVSEGDICVVWVLVKEDEDADTTDVNVDVEASLDAGAASDCAVGAAVEGAVIEEAPEDGEEIEVVKVEGAVIWEAVATIVGGGVEIEEVTSVVDGGGVDVDWADEIAAGEGGGDFLLDLASTDEDVDATLVV